MATANANSVSAGPAVQDPLLIRRSTPGLFDRWLARRVQRLLDPAPVRLVLWDEAPTVPPPDGHIGDLFIKDRRVLVGLATNPELWFGEGYAAGRLEVRGPLEPVLEALSRASLSNPSWRDRLNVALAGANSLIRARRNVHHHYDIGNDFYTLWLDREVVYTCAYFPTPDATLEEAQRAKHDRVCRKLRLKPGDTVVEAGCGWGALALHMARYYSARVRAFNVSTEQLAFARERAAREGLAGRVEFIDDDYRNISGQYDVFVSVGMLEHVGLRQFGALAEVLRRSIKHDTGRGLLHFIGRDLPRPLNGWIRRRIFPGSYAPTLAQVTKQIMEPAGMSVADVENLRLHYALTLRHWAERFENAKERVRASLGEEFRRAWELYLNGSQAAFAAGWLQLFQVMFTPRQAAPPAWTRDDPWGQTPTELL